MNQEKIHFRVARDFGEIFNISFKFLRQNFKLFFACILFIAGPFILISAITGSFYQAHQIAGTGITYAQRLRNPFEYLGIWYFLLLIASTISNLSLIGTTYAYMLIYNEKGPGNFTIGDVAKKLWHSIGGMLGIFFMAGFILLLIAGVMVLVIIGLSSITPILTGLFILALFVGLLIVMPPFFWQMSVMYLIKMGDETHLPFDTYGRTTQVMKSNFWWTWVLVFCAMIMILIASFVFSMPQIIYQVVLTVINMRGGGTGETSAGFMVVTTICTFFNTLLYSVLYIICGFHYFSLAEKKEGTGMLERINEIGQTPENNVEQHY